MAHAPPQTQETVAELAEQLGSHSTTTAIAVEHDRFPPRVIVDLSTPTIHSGIHDLLDQYNATVDDVEARADTSGELPGLRLTVSAGEVWKDAGNRTLREQGSSLVVNIPPEAVDASRLSADETLDIHARSGELHIKSHEDGPRFP